MNTGTSIDLNIVKHAIKFCWPLALSALLWYFLSGVDKIFLEELDDVNSLALFNIAASLAGKLAIFYTALSQTMEPDMYKAIAVKRYRRLAYIVLGLIILNAIPNVIFIIIAKPILHLFTGGRYTEAYTFARILILTNITRSFYYATISVIVGLGFTKSELLNRLCGAIISLFMYKYLINNFGYNGAAWGQSFSYILMTIIGVIFIYFRKKR